MIRCFAGRALAPLAALGILLSGPAPALAQFTGDSCLEAFGQPVLSGGTNGLESLVVGDIDADGAPDIVTASIGDDRIGWFENPEDPDVEWLQHTISLDADGATSVVVADLDKSCPGAASGATPCLDVVSASANDNKIAWYRNNGQAEPKFEEIVISTGAQLAQAVYAADVNGDGHIDVLSASFQDNTIAWYENDGAAFPTVPEFTEHAIATDASGAASVFAIDMDRDGDIDVLSASRLDDKVAWYENLGAATEGDPPDFETHVISQTSVRATFVVAADLNADNFPDVVVASNGNGVDTGSIAWFKSSGTLPLTFTEEPILEGLSEANEVYASDVVYDFDNGAIDVLAAYENTITLFENDGISPQPTFVPVNIATMGVGTKATSVYAADLNGDLAVDVQSTSTVPGLSLMDDEVAWYVNPGATPEEGTSPFEKKTVSQNAQSPESIAITDIDADGWLDVVLASSVDDTIAWERNDGGDPLGFSYYEIATDADRAIAVVAADLDDNCAMAVGPCIDVVAAAPGNGIDGKIVWYQNLGFTPTGFQGEPPAYVPPDFSPEQVILQGEADPVGFGETEPPTMSLNAEPMSVFAADLDGSGFDDVIGAIRVAADGVPDRISWFRDPGTLPAEVPEFDISTQLEGPRAVYAVDLNADGLIDVLSASTNDNKITLFVNDGLDSSETPPRPVFVEVPISTNALGAMWVTAADLFGDCNSAEPAPCLEVLSASSRDNKIAWYQITTEAPPAATAIVPSAGTPSLSVTPDPLDFGNVFVGRIDTESLEPAPKMLPVTIENGGVDPLVITSITSTAPQFTPSVTDLTVPAGMSGEIGVGFLPSSGATFSGTLEFTVDGATEPAAGIDMSGVGLTFVENVLTTSAFFARYVSTGDVDGNGLTDVLSASSGDRRITAWLQQDTDPVTFRDLVIEDNANNARSAMVANLDQDPAGSADVVTAHYFTIRWHEGGIEERCNDFDVDGDERMAGAELSWIWLAFTQSGDPQGGTEWWRPVDYNKDGIIDGDDVAIAAGAGVWTRFVNPTSGDPAGPVCNYSCISQD